MRATFWGDMEISEEDAANPRALFGRLDKDGNGGLSPGELPNSRIKDGFNYLDQNKNGQMEFGEFHQFHASDKWDGRNVMVAVDAGGGGRRHPQPRCLGIYEEFALRSVSACDWKSGLHREERWIPDLPRFSNRAGKVSRTTGRQWRVLFNAISSGRPHRDLRQGRNSIGH